MQSSEESNVVSCYSEWKSYSRGVFCESALDLPQSGTITGTFTRATQRQSRNFHTDLGLVNERSKIKVSKAGSGIVVSTRRLTVPSRLRRTLR